MDPDTVFETGSDAVTEAQDDGKIVCKIDGSRQHSIQLHIQKNYPDTWTIDRYQKEFPDAPLLSKYAEEITRRGKAKKAQTENTKDPVVTAINYVSSMTATREPMHKVFDLGESTPGVKNTRGEFIASTVFQNHNSMDKLYLPKIDTDYVFPLENLRQVMAALELGMTLYIWGMHGTGKTTLAQQASARTGRPFIRVQHTQNMQETDVLGMWTIENGSTKFQLGPLAEAMLYGYVYCADEYDYAMPAVVSVYQPVLEGESLLIKDAPPQYRKIDPHPNFRFVATGNTNGVGDETGLYQGTLIQNAANYSRFAMTMEVDYMNDKLEQSILINKTGIESGLAASLTRFARDVRNGFRDGKISMTISPRELLHAAKMIMIFGGIASWRTSIELAYANRLSKVDKKVVTDFAQRIFDAGT